MAMKIISLACATERQTNVRTCKHGKDKWKSENHTSLDILHVTGL